MTILIFLTLCLVNPTQRKVWGTLVIMTTILWFNTLIFPNEFNSPLFHIRPFIVFFSALILIKIYTLHSVYQSCISVMTLFLFLLLEYDLITGSNLVYDKYEDLVYGIILARIMGVVVGIYEQIWLVDRDNTSYNNHYFLCKIQGKIK